jgi:TonB-linked SusC/RagA family outer membrane protein
MVVDASTGSGVAGATVALASDPSITATTADDGSFALAKVPADELRLEVAAEGFDAVIAPVKSGRAKLELVIYVRASVEAPPPTRVVSGFVKDAITGEPLPGATLRVQGTELAATADNNGLFSIPGVAMGDVVLEVAAGDHEAGTTTVAAGTTAVSLGLQPTTPPPAAPEQGAEAAPAARTITGRVVELGTGQPVIGATVAIVGSELGAITDAAGRFSIANVPPGPAPLSIESFGYDSQNVIVQADQVAAEVTLSVATTETIVIEGRAPVIVKQNLANGASTVQAQDLTRVSASTLEDAMQAKVSGANLQANSGAPGGGAQLRLRGISTINGQSSPLYVIDGVIVSNVAVSSGANAVTQAAAGGNASSQDNPVNRIADLNPNDIENIEVLKGASAAALYGSKAANGVVIITTKRGRAGEAPRVNVTQRFGVSQLSNKLGSRTWSADEIMDFYGESALGYFDGTSYDHEAELTQTALATETIASASGGTDSGAYFGSVLVRDEPGIVKGTYYEKQSGRVGASFEVGDRLRIGLTSNLIHTTSDRGLTNNDNTGTSNYVVLSSTPSFFRLGPDAAGVFPRNPFVGSQSNPLQTVELFKNKEDVWRLIGSATGNLSLWKDAEHSVDLTSTFGADRFQQRNSLFSPNELFFENADSLPGTSIEASTANLNANVLASAIWAFTPSSGALRSALSLGFTFEYQDLQSVYVTGQNLNAGRPNIDSAAVRNENENRLRTKERGLFVQEEVSVLDDKLSFLVGLLAEQSSLNGDPDKLFLFPKVATTYQLPVLADTFETFRVRAAYGQTGNRPVYGQKFTPQDATGIIDGSPGVVVGGVAGDPNIEPERQSEVELGLDLAMTDDRMVVELTGYQRDISNLLLQRTLAPSTGFTTQFFNGGELRNRGVEAAVQATPVASSALSWTTRATVTLNRSEVTQLDVPSFDIAAAGFGTGLGAYRIEEGESVTQIVGTIGTDEMTGAPIVAKLGDGEPDFRVSFSNKFAFGDFGLTGLLDWQQGSKVVNLTRLLYDFGAVSPDFVGEGEARLDAFSNSDIRPYIEDGTFLKLREVSLFYTVPKQTLKTLGFVNNLVVSLSGRNLVTVTGYSGLDPEVSNFGNQPIGRNYDVAPYPPSRSYWLSVDAGF